MQVVDFNVQVACFYDGFPKEEEEEKHDEKDERALHHFRDVEASREVGVVSVKEYLRTNQSVPHQQKRDGMNTHDRKQHQGLIGKPAQSDDGHEHLEELEPVDGQHSIKARNFGITSVPKFT